MPFTVDYITLSLQVKCVEQGIFERIEAGRLVRLPDGSRTTVSVSINTPERLPGHPALDLGVALGA